VGAGHTTVIPTETIAVIGAKTAELRWVQREYGLTLAQEGSHGKVLLAVPADADDPIAHGAEAARKLYERGEVDGATRTSCASSNAQDPLPPAPHPSGRSTTTATPSSLVPTSPPKRRGR
jgi:hypothetical protein